MNLNIKSSYGYLISHTFPGFLLALEILIFVIFNNKLIWNQIDYDNICIINLIGIINLTLLLIIFFIISTILGIIIDAIRHLIFYRLGENALELKDEKIFKSILNSDQLLIYNKIADDYWYFYEAYGNIGITLLFGIILFILYYCFASYNQFWWIFGICLVIIIMIGMLYIAWLTLKEILRIENNFIINIRYFRHKR